ncbi:MAG: hypothetical protein WBN70_05970 [Polyangiales bacterium]
MVLRDDTTAFLSRVSGKLVYGAIVLEALLGALGDPLPGSPIVLVSLMLSMAVVVIAGAYSDWVGEHMEMRMLTSWGDRLRGLGSIARGRSWILAPLLVPGTFFGLEIIGLLSHTGAYALTRVVLLGVLLFFGFAAARLSGAGVLGSTLSAAVVTLFGYVVAQAKILAKLVQALGK